jgi:ectoine hydroxylase-related dioxygenase (phytanoyl-CoA dioxygenase family)
MYSIEQAIEQYERDGFFVFRGVIDEDLVAEADRHVRWLTARYPELRPEHLHHPLMRDDAFWVRLVSDERLLDIAQIFLGPDIVCFTAHYICKPPLDGHPVLWHQDGAYWKLEPMDALTLWLAIDATTPANGCLRMIPGSHKIPLEKPELRSDPPNMLYSSARPDLVDEWHRRNGVVDVMLRPGDVSIHHPRLLHCSESNTSANRRCGLDMGFMRATTRISNEALYLDPILVRGCAAPGVNTYRAWPLAKPGETIAFRGDDLWNDMARRRNELGQFRAPDPCQKPPLEVAMRMIQRLQEGTVKQ